MAWRVTADPERFEEAMRFLGSRAIMTADAAIDIDAKARQKAFWIGAGLQLHEIQSVMDSLQKAVDKGEPYAEWRKRVKQVLRSDSHAETVFRNATQRAYNIGRWSQMQDPANLLFRPFLMYDAILDSRTTEICNDANGTVLPAEHPWWLRNQPPRHHRCRSSIRSLRRKEAERRGISTDGPNEAEGDFGAAPDDDDLARLMPDAAKTDPELLRKLREKRDEKPKRKRQKKATPGPAKKKKPTKKVERRNLQTPREHHDPDYWTARYRERYGESATAVGWGRAMHERMLDRPAAEVLEQAQKLLDQGHPALNTYWARSLVTQLRKLPPDSTLRGAAFLQLPATSRYQSLLAQIEHSRHIRRASFPIDVINDEARKAKAFYEAMLDSSVKRPDGFRIRLEPGIRANCDDTLRIVSIDPDVDGYDVYVHEFAHAIEFADQRALNRSFDFHESRTKGEVERPLSELVKGADYKPWETAKPDEYDTAFGPYQGKVYYAEGGGRRVTEMTPVGYQELASDRLSGKDPELLFFMLGELAGR